MNSPAAAASELGGQLRQGVIATARVWASEVFALSIFAQLVERRALNLLLKETAVPLSLCVLRARIRTSLVEAFREDQRLASFDRWRGRSTAGPFRYRTNRALLTQTSAQDYPRTFYSRT